MPNPVLERFGRPFRLGLAGGAPPSLIGPVHRTASVMDQRFQLVAGVLSSRPERALTEGRAAGLAEDRCYASVEAMISGEARRPDGIEAVAIITPNDSHARYVRLALEGGLDVMVEKPLCNDLGEALALADLARRTGRAVALTHTYSGYPMIRDMRARIEAGEIGQIRLVQVDYMAGGLATRVEDAPDAARRWRLDPAVSGPSLVLGDIGTHAHHLVGFVTGERLASVSADVGTLMPGRRVHDIAQVRFRLGNGARGRIDACNAAAGASNQVSLTVYGETGHLRWEHRHHGRLVQANLDGDIRIIGSGQPNLTDMAKAATRLMRPGHPEGLQEAVANLYCGLADEMLARRGLAPAAATLTPSIADGVAGLAFVEACLASSAAGGAHVELATHG
ncbi:Gfo/Idh/MocA family protein [Phreatobacter stygius]|nr:Gfo/Idh/MocA family oxidoreductase [Phreatobacter stygius]